MTRYLKYITNFLSKVVWILDFGIGKDDCHCYEKVWDNKSGTSTTNQGSVIFSNKEGLILLWNFQSGHPNFVYLEKLFPSIFHEKPRNLHCQICQLSKHAHSPHPIIPYKPPTPLSSRHIDVWGPLGSITLLAINASLLLMMNIQ